MTERTRANACVCALSALLALTVIDGGAALLGFHRGAGSLTAAALLGLIAVMATIGAAACLEELEEERRARAAGPREEWEGDADEDG